MLFTAVRTDLPPINEPGFSRAHAGPSVRRFARELGVDLTLVKGGGFKGRITHDDVKAFVKSFLASGSSGGAAGAGAATAKGAPAAAAWPGSRERTAAARETGPGTTILRRH